MSERALQNMIIQVATLLGWKTYHTFDSRRSSPGWPDLVLCKAPRLLIRELKTEHGRLRAEQLHWLKALQDCGMDAKVWRPSDWEEIVQTLQGHSVT